MELFKLLGTIAIDNAAANKALKETTSAAKETGETISGTSDSGDSAGGKLSGAFQKIGSGALALGKTVVKGVGVAAAGVSALATAAINSYADYEQLVGGVDTLFKDSSGKVQEYAKNAYKTAGLSANEYMETVTSFSASLIQSLGGDTEMAAEYAQTAITDMSDNANKMGTDIGMIQNAYGGFAKGNFTMLDNLKLGYGGTYEEMQRLLRAAEEIAGLDYNSLNIASFSDIVQAIHIIQTEMGITGTTAKEASSTISGSIASMKSSWQNLLTAISSDDLPFDDYVNSFVDSVSTVVGNLMPRISTALNGVVQLIDKLAPVIIGKLPELFNQLLPAIIEAATSMISSLVDALPGIVSALTSALPALIGGIMDIMGELIFNLGNIINSLAPAIPGIVSGLIDLFLSVFVMLAQELPYMIEPILTMLPDLIMQVADVLVMNLYMLLEYIPVMIQEIMAMIPTVLPQLIAAVQNLVQMLAAELPYLLDYLIDGIIILVTSITEQLPVLIPMLVEAVIQIITMLTEQLPVFVPLLVEAVVQIVNMICEQLPVIIPMLIEAAIQVTVALIAAMPDIVSALVQALPGILQAVWDVIVMVFTELPGWFKQLWDGVNEITKAVWDAIEKSISAVLDFLKNHISNIWNGIKTTTSAVWNGIKGALSATWNGIKTTVTSVWNGIKSTTTTVWEGIKTAITKPIEKAKDLIKGIVDKIKGFFNFTITLPKIKLPHFSIKPEGWKLGDLLEGSIPSLGIDWYAKAMKNPMVMTKPTVFGYNAETGKLQAGGEAGSEVVTGTGTLMGMIQAAVASQNEALVYAIERIIEILASYFPQLLEALDMDVVLNDGVLVGRLAPKMNEELGKILARKDRGR